jgi:hypothetical protein
MSKSHYRFVHRNYRKGNVVRTWTTDVPVTYKQAMFRAYHHMMRGTYAEMLLVGSEEEAELLRELEACPLENPYM